MTHTVFSLGQRILLLKINIDINIKYYMLHYIVTYTYNIYIITLRYITTSYKKMCQINPGVE